MPDTGRYTSIPKPFIVGDRDPIPSNLPNLVELLRDKGLPVPQTGPSNDSWRGWLLTTGRGIYAAFDVAEDPIIAGGYIPDGWIFYAPTALPHGKGCLEITNFHSAQPPGAAIGVYDFCNAHNWVQTIALNDPATRNCCVRSYTDAWDGTTRQRYFVQVYSDNPAAPDGSYDRWTALVYSFEVGLWRAIAVSSGINPDTSHSGWIFHESRHVAGTDPLHPGTCYQLRSVSASEVEIRLSDGNFWLPDDFPGLYTQYFPGGLSGYPQNCWSDYLPAAPWTYQTHSYYGWRVATPTRSY